MTAPAAGGDPVPGTSLDAVPALPRDEGGPVFDEPWQAQAFAMTIRLHEAGLFTWKEWVAALSAEIAAADDGPGRPYYALWLSALEKLVAEKGLASQDAMATRTAEWRDAYLRTPHGQPVELR